MNRTHNFVRYLQLMSLMARATRELEALERTDIDFQLDREFSTKLDELVKRYGYTDQEVLDIVKLVQEHETQGSKGVNILMSRIPPNDVPGSGEGR